MMTVDEMISKLDEACGRLLVPSITNPSIAKVMEMVTEVSVALGDSGDSND